jgi:oligoendopeptidase F
MHFLDPALRRGCIERSTLDAMMNAVSQQKSIGQKALALKAKMMGVANLGPWDLFAPCPDEAKATSLMTFDAATELISDAFSSIDPSMGAFVKTMQENRWIEGSVQGNKRPGAYCTKFLKSRTPRVYMTYAGNMDNVSTLAHELGHAFHSWLMRDLPLSQLSYPMTLAETASIFAETVLNDYLISKNKHDTSLLLPFLWSNASDAEVFLLNIPSRFTFEYELNERRQRQLLTPDEMSEMMAGAWSKWYEGSLCEMNPMFWASKLHFHMSSLSFYNFPYTFGYLFSLGVYAQREALGASFFARYVDLLRDTGRMTAEELAAKYLGCDLSKPDFWLASLAIVQQKVDMLASLDAGVMK